MKKEPRLVAVLRMLTAKEPEQTFSLYEGESLQAGRGLDNDMVLRDATVSRVHAVFSASSTGVVVNDMFSRNGTFVNGERISAVRHLWAGDVVDIGPMKITVVFPNSDQLPDKAEALTEDTTTMQLVPVPLTVLLVAMSNHETLRKSLGKAGFESVVDVFRSRVSKLIMQYSGIVDKATESSLMAHWLEENELASAVAACQAALYVRREVPVIVEEMGRALGAVFDLKISFVLSSGTGMRRNNESEPSNKGETFVVLGQPAKLVSNLYEAIGSFGYDLIIPEATALLVQSKLKAKKVFSVKLKGKDELVSAYTIEE